MYQQVHLTFSSMFDSAQGNGKECWGEATQTLHCLTFWWIVPPWQKGRPHEAAMEVFICTPDRTLVGNHTILYNALPMTSAAVQEHSKNRRWFNLQTISVPWHLLGQRLTSELLHVKLFVFLIKMTQFQEPETRPPSLLWILQRR